MGMTDHVSPVSLNIHADVADLTQALVDYYSVSGHETVLADAVEAELVKLPRLSVHRIGDTVIARTNFGSTTRVVLAGHLDTVPLPTVAGSRGTVPSEWAGETLYGRGTTDMKGGVAVQLSLAAEIGSAEGPAPESLGQDITWVFYDHEEVAAEYSGLGRVSEEAPELLEADFAVLLEPTNGVVEGGCNGTNRYRVTTRGVAAHSGRAWKGVNAIHAAAPVLGKLAEYEPQTVTVQGLDYREGLNAVDIQGGVATNVIPDSCSVLINYRFAPDKTLQEAHEHVYSVLGQAGIVPEQIEVTDESAAAKPGLDHPSAVSFMRAVGTEAKPKYGWTDVARFSQLGVPAVNFGPGDALLAHTDNEHVTKNQLAECLNALRQWLIGS